MFLKCLGSITSCARHKKNRLNGLSEICRKQRMSQLNVLLCDFWIRRHDRADGRSRSGQNDPEFNSFFYMHATEARAFLWTIPTAWLGSVLLNSTAAECQGCRNAAWPAVGNAHWAPELQNTLLTLRNRQTGGPSCSPVFPSVCPETHRAPPPFCTAACAVRFTSRGWKRFCSKTLYEQTFPPGIVIWFKLKNGPEFMMSYNYYSWYRSLN